jgi:hypothetical protein
MAREIYIGNINVKDNLYTALLTYSNGFNVFGVPKNISCVISEINQKSSIDSVIIKFVKKADKAWADIYTEFDLYPLKDSEKKKIISEIKKNNISYEE